MVVGGSQAGLATGYHLSDAGIDHLILEEHDEIGGAWRDRWDSLHLFTPSAYSGLPGLAQPGPPHSILSKDDMADYLAAYATRFELPIRTGVRVEGVSTVDNGFLVETGEGVVTADNVVVATGAYHHPRVPDFAEDLGEDILQMHSYHYRRPSQLQDGAVLVVGAANSGAEIAIELSDEHDVFLSGRDVGMEPTTPGTIPDRLFTPIMWIVASRVLDVANPIGRRVRDHFLHPPRGVPLGRVKKKDFIVAGVERVARTSGVEDGLPLLEDGRALDVRNVIWCTGFGPDFTWIDAPILDEWGYPRHERGVVESQPGLYFMGLLFQSTLSSALVAGVGRDAEHVARHIAQRQTALSRGEPAPHR
ncbi:MAG: NAD(P)-binding domain-containing protein [Acidimicrobiia bacterium]